MSVLIAVARTFITLTADVTDNFCFFGIEKTPSSLTELDSQG
jgi:hypothetical protein